MQLRAEQLEGHLARNLALAYAIHGDEPLLALEAADAVRAAARKRGFTDREVFEPGRNFDWSELEHALGSLSLFGGKKIVELRLATGKPGAQGGAAIARYCERPSAEVLLLVSVPRLDRATQGSAWFGALARAGAVVDVYPVERPRLPAWIAERLARQRQKAPREALELLADRVEGNLLAAHQEVQKLALLAPEGEVGLDALREAVANVARYDAYSASEAMLEGDAARFVRIIDGLRGEGEAPTLVLWVLSEELFALARIQAGVAAGRSSDDLLRENRVWGTRQRPMKAAAGRVAPAAVNRALAHAARIDRAIKGVGAGEPWDELLKLGLELQPG
ncbi:MAG: DNA polymerase III subunit delta [Betaproteobacteria bacterium RIFCSPLOWO2_12_FULL_65_14]|nr:MAG: DNA polymerase III subunit delta [Betaproteobacteria bacterium RIFCSPLOWO2_12_FULL_65_14]